MMSKIFVRPIRVVLIIMLLGNFQFSQADGFSQCGEYLVSGILRAKPDGMQVIVDENTRSEIHISLKILDAGRIAGLLDLPLTVGLLLDEKFDGTRGRASAITQKAKMRVPDPMGPNKSFSLVRALECKSK